ncbi:pfkB-like carbohydrate kinase family protein [Actinidia rufa]|uniref:PfkB-like carbohydrate kinase family protein n=1 Tax=Actinidia rufa TaxID=165716 RepID=A0A7J0GWP2_9ERIC|nr:pfkB-like carbohydrate kinase family protein [Actinidia rufa]
MLIDFVPTVGGGSLAEAPAFKKVPGGAPANVAVGIARLGGSSAFIGKVNLISFCPLSPLFIRNADLIEKFAFQIQASIFHYGSISLIEEPCRSTHMAAMKIAKECGCVLSYDPNLRLALWPSEEASREGIMSIWDKADVVKQFKGRVPGVKVKAVDTTGAGDAFVGGILNSLASDLSLHEDEKRLRESLLFANACGALMVTEKGAISALPTKEAVLQVLTEVAA